MHWQKSALQKLHSFIQEAQVELGGGSVVKHVLSA
jgi:hypothetical protein